MPRPKLDPSSPAAGWLVEPLRLGKTPANRDAVLELAALAGLTGASFRPLWEATREALELYPGLKSHPSSRPAAELVGLEHAERQTTALRAALEALHVETRDRLTMAGADLGGLRLHLEAFDRAISIATQKLSGHESRGAETNDARRTVVMLIARAYQERAEVDPDWYLDGLRDYLLCACKLAGIPLPRADRVLDLIPASAKVPIRTP